MQNATATILPTNNEAWGFFGTIRHDVADPIEAWTIAMRAIAKETGCSEAGVREFLDSRFGRHFADEVATRLSAGNDLPQAVDAAITRWMGWRTGRPERRDYGIPQGLPYLTGFVTHCKIMADPAAD